MGGDATHLYGDATYLRGDATYYYLDATYLYGITTGIILQKYSNRKVHCDYHGFVIIMKVCPSTVKSFLETYCSDYCSLA